MFCDRVSSITHSSADHVLEKPHSEQRRIDLIYRKDSILQKRIFQLEVDAERELIETEDLVA